MVDGAYERKIAVTFFNKPTEVQALQEGATYNVSFNLESREYNDRWYTDIRAWKVVPAAAGSPAPAPAAQPMAAAAPAPAPAPAPAAQPAPAPAAAIEEEEDDLPF